MMATAVVRACRPIIATNSDPNGCIRWSRTGAYDPSPSIAITRPTSAPERIAAVRRQAGSARCPAVAPLTFAKTSAITANDRGSHAAYSPASKI